MKADRYRAYGLVETPAKGEDAPRKVEDVVAEGKVIDGKAEFDAGEQKVTRVVFYGGPRDGETVVGSTDVNAAGAISAEFSAE